MCPCTVVVDYGGIYKFWTWQSNIGSRKQKVHQTVLACSMFIRLLNRPKIAPQKNRAGYGWSGCKGNVLHGQFICLAFVYRNLAQKPDIYCIITISIMTILQLLYYYCYIVLYRVLYCCICTNYNRLGFSCRD